MTGQQYALLGIQVLWVVLFMSFFKFRELPLILRCILSGAYITCPVAIAIGGMDSAVYMFDLMGAILVIYFLRRSHIFIKLFSNRFFMVFFLLFMAIPILTSFILYSSGFYLTSSRQWLFAGIWFYRNSVLLMALGVGLNARLDRNQIRRFIEMNLGLGAILAIFGVFNYFGPINMAIYETIQADVADQDYRVSELASYRVGDGFLGLPRHTVGTWFAIIVTLSVASYGFISRRFKFFALLSITGGALVTLLSYSRAGALGLFVGVVVVGIGKGFRAILLIAFLGSIFYGLSETRLLGDRFSIERTGYSYLVSGRDVGDYQRTQAWKLSMQYFLANPETFFWGVGVENSIEVSEHIGLYFAHNAYIDAIWRSGILGLLLLIWALTIMAIYIWRQKVIVQGAARDLLWGLLGVFSANAVIGVTQQYLYYSGVAFLGGFYVCILYGVFLGACWSKKDRSVVLHLDSSDKTNVSRFSKAQI